MDLVIVTGASKGIGRQVCIELLRRHSVAVIAVARSSAALQSLQDESQHLGQLVFISGDISSAETRDAIVGKAVELGGRLRALINNAAVVLPTGPVLANTDSEWRVQWETNFLAPVSLLAKCLPLFKSHGMSKVVLNISSSTSQAPVPAFGPYGCTKVALNYLTQAVAAEYPDITAIAFYPGVVDTPMNKNALDAAQSFHEYAAANGLGVDMSKCIDKLQTPIQADIPCVIMANLALGADPELSGKYFVYSDREMEAYSR
ncbi:hypothetical protein IWW55_000073 [Coemansia sp. RSA 2706]|nr:hypothetical protein LPJ63_002424 [Coemansia sp. RSA 2711]KAJ2308982.1 hypothetical protein IWW55_000073 [Coemansia sp. RSA 2706]KAJ2315720.1 hypothetical protein IWW54_000089 [Coemansia sp. RSA 2705]KAJ2322418.1 hypothetical protein IWW52_000066 [Coemansia sp. RSA 2704]KAJ2330205.1 hypothetical protein IWW51_000065 [Coemansia sp. RSA 2702]KAJ2739965.1 hypothetical protein H4R23_000063 [Coemansia sp. Cherry 401B]